MDRRVGVLLVCLLFLLIGEVSAIAETEIGDVRVAREAPDVKLDDAGRQDVLKSGRVSVYTVAWSTLAMAAATGLGSLPFFFLELEAQWAGLCNGMAAGVMLAASFDLVQEGQMYGSGSWVVFGILSGGVFIWLCKKLLEQHGEVSMLDIKGADASKVILVVGIMTLHSFGEGSGVGVSFAGSKGFSQGLLITIAIAVHNIPEGLAVSMLLSSRGVSPQKAMLWSIITSLPQPIVAVPAFLCADAFQKVLPFCTGFAAGCMIWIVIAEVLPDAFKEATPSQVASAGTLAVAFMEALSLSSAASLPRRHQTRSPPQPHNTHSLSLLPLTPAFALSEMPSTAYSRPSKLPGGAGERRLPPRLMRSFTGKIEPKKLGLGLLAGGCLALLTYVSLAKLFAIYSPVFASTANASGLLQNAPPGSSSAPQKEAVPPLEDTTFAGRKNDDPADPVDFPEEGPAVAVTEEPGLPEALVSKKEKEAALPSEPNPSEKDQDKSIGDAKMACDENGIDEGFPYARPAVCELSGDIRVSPKQKTMYLVNPSGVAGGFDEKGEKKVRPYARNDDFLLPAVVEVTVKSLPSAEAAPQCTKRHRVPAVVFSVAGYTDNFFHDNTDVMIPLFLTAGQLKGEVQLLITNYKPWWVQKYTPLLSKLSNYPVINFDEDASVHCFTQGFLDMYRDRDLILSPHPTRNPRNLTMLDYNRFVRNAYGLRREQPAVLGEEPGMRPQMLIISRSGTRKLLNLDEVAAAATALGFNVTVAEAGADVPAFAALVNSADVLLAVHGAGLTNQIFLPTNAVVLQIVPWGNMNWQATNFYGQPARDMQLRYLEYFVDEEETSLKDKYPKDHVVFKDPKALHTQGWQVLAETIMKQDVKVNLTRFQPFLLQAIDKLQE